MMTIKIGEDINRTYPSALMTSSSVTVVIVSSSHLVEIKFGYREENIY